MNSFTRFHVRVPAALGAFLLSVLTFPAISQTTGPEPPPTQARTIDSSSRAQAVEFLKKVEVKNEELKSLEAEFEQLRVDPIFLDEVESKGRFWYQAPGKFRASYDARHPSEIWIFPDHLVNYSPTIKQVNILPLRQGDDAPINQMLLGFGMKTENILEVFDVAFHEAESEDHVAIKFKSLDLDRSLFYERIIIHFEKENAQPVKLFLEDGESEITVTLKSIKRNPTVDPKLFETSWPDDVEIIDER